ncbi:MAG: YceH family protein [Thermoleophilia bacterium]|nr:YceH family protein [Thermoleophilia bacterium]
MDADPVEIRVLGCLIEKQRTTPDTYPLTLNSLRLACNQATNREPVVEYDEETIRDALQRLWRREWARLASGQGSRSVKYRQLVEDTLGLAGDEISILCVLMLRGPQTPGELKQRSDRLHPFGELADVEETLGRLISRDFVARLERRPGQKEERYAQLLGGEVDDTVEPVAPRPVLARDPLEERVAALEAEVAALRAALTDLGL